MKRLHDDGANGLFSAVVEATDLPYAIIATTHLRGKPEFPCPDCILDWPKDGYHSRFEGRPITHADVRCSYECPHCWIPECVKPELYSFLDEEGLGWRVLKKK